MAYTDLNKTPVAPVTTTQALAIHQRLTRVLALLDEALEGMEATQVEMEMLLARLAGQDGNGAEVARVAQGL
jgi:hypothetical protein